MIKLNFGDFFDNDIKSESIDAVITDPPYFILNEGWDKGDFTSFTTHWLKECKRVLKPGGTLYSFMAYKRHYEFHDLMKLEFNRVFENDVVWARSKGRSSSKHLKSLREDIYYGYKDGPKPIWNELKTLREVIAPYMLNGRPRGWFVDETGKRVRWTGLGNIWMYSAPNWSSKGDRQIHPTQKPVMLLDRLIRLTSNPSDIILDPFMGVASTAVACKLNDRNFIGYEITKKYYDDGVKRLDDFNMEDYTEFCVGT